MGRGRGGEGGVNGHDDDVGDYEEVDVLAAVAVDDDDDCLRVYSLRGGVGGEGGVEVGRDMKRSVDQSSGRFF